MKIVTFTASVLLVLAMPPVLMAQSPVALAKEIETSLKAKDHKRKLKVNVKRGQACDLRFSIGVCQNASCAPSGRDIQIKLDPGVARFALTPGYFLLPFQGNHFTNQADNLEIGGLL